MYLLRKGKRSIEILDSFDEKDNVLVQEINGIWRQYPKVGGFSVEKSRCVGEN